MYDIIFPFREYFVKYFVLFAYREEGVLQYIPELPRPFEATINYNKSVFNIRVIRSFATGLESTSLVIFYGLGKPDLF